MLKRVAELRHLLINQQAIEEEARLQLEDTPEWAALQEVQESVKETRAELRVAEAEARKAIIEQYDGTKKGEGWGIRVMKRTSYDVTEATEWARTHLRSALVLDKKTFEKVAPLLEGAPIEIYDEVTATIDSDLSFLLS